MSDAIRFDVHWFDPTTHLQTGEQPVAMLERPLASGTRPKKDYMLVAEVGRLGRYWVPESPIFAESVEWTLTADGTHVRVPVFSYRTRAQALAAIFGTGVQVGMAALEQLRARTNESIIEIVLILGHDCPPVNNPEGYACFIGITIRTKD